MPPPELRTSDFAHAIFFSLSIIRLAAIAKMVKLLQSCNLSACRTPVGATAKNRRHQQTFIPGRATHRWLTARGAWSLGDDCPLVGGAAKRAPKGQAHCAGDPPPTGRLRRRNLDDL